MEMAAAPRAMSSDQWCCAGRRCGGGSGLLIILEAKPHRESMPPFPGLREMIA
jgi:hypothetical protein